MCLCMHVGIYVAANSGPNLVRNYRVREVPHLYPQILINNCSPGYRKKIEKECPFANRAIGGKWPFDGVWFYPEDPVVTLIKPGWWML